VLEINSANSRIPYQELPCGGRQKKILLAEAGRKDHHATRASPRSLPSLQVSDAAVQPYHSCVNNIGRKVSPLDEGYPSKEDNNRSGKWEWGGSHGRALRIRVLASDRFIRVCRLCVEVVRWPVELMDDRVKVGLIDREVKEGRGVSPGS
jgi:hypothetical protein